MGSLAAIGIIKGKPFAPDARMKKILTEAAALANATPICAMRRPNGRCSTSTSPRKMPAPTGTGRSSVQNVS
jgi:hypothetical protein